MNAKALYATLVLGLQLIFHIIRKILRRPSPGLKVFLANYRDDGIPTMSSEEKALLYELSRCVSCGLCDTLCTILPDTNPADFMGPAYYPSSASRLIPDYPYVNLDAGACDTCIGCDAICPRQVPIRNTFDLMRRKVEAIRS